MDTDDANASASGADGADAKPNADLARASAGSVHPAGDGDPATHDAVLLADPGMTADSASRVSSRDVEKARDRATAPKRAAPSEPVPDPAEQYRVRQLDEFRAEHKERIRPFDGAERVGSVVAAAVGTAIVHVGRLEYVEVSLPSASRPPDIGANVSIDRSGALSSAVPQAEKQREPISLDRSL